MYFYHDGVEREVPNHRAHSHALGSSESREAIADEVFRIVHPSRMHVPERGEEVAMAVASLSRIDRRIVLGEVLDRVDAAGWDFMGRHMAHDSIDYVRLSC